MSLNSAKVRIFVDKNLKVDSFIELNAEQSRYVFNVMRLKLGQNLFVIDGVSGEYLGKILSKKGKFGSLQLIEKIRDVVKPPDLWLMFAPVKRSRTDIIIEKATELGVRSIRPIYTERTNSRLFRPKRMRSIMKEALEQCGGTFLPSLEEPVGIENMLKFWPHDRSLIYCDETLAEKVAAQKNTDLSYCNPAGILIGPEGGFSKSEAEKIYRIPKVKSVCLGPRILRADTAAISAISLWQHSNGDW